MCVPLRQNARVCKNMFLRTISYFLRTLAPLCSKTGECVKIVRNQIVCKKYLPPPGPVCKNMFTHFLRTLASLCGQMRECVKMCISGFLVRLWSVGRLVFTWSDCVSLGAECVFFYAHPCVFVYFLRTRVYFFTRWQIFYTCVYIFTRKPCFLHASV